MPPWWSASSVERILNLSADVMGSPTECDEGVAAGRTRPFRGCLLSPQAGSPSRDPFTYFITVVFRPRPIWALSGTPAGLITGIGPPPVASSWQIVHSAHGRLGQTLARVPGSRLGSGVAVVAV